MKQEFGAQAARLPNYHYGQDTVHTDIDKNFLLLILHGCVAEVVPEVYELTGYDLSGEHEESEE